MYFFKSFFFKDIGYIYLQKKMTQFEDSQSNLSEWKQRGDGNVAFMFVMYLLEEGHNAPHRTDVFICLYF